MRAAAVPSSAPASGTLITGNQGRALGLGVVVLERTGAPWSEFRDHLVAASAAHEPASGESAATAYYTAYYTAWLDAIEALLAARGLT
jgi:hypothetical protein